MDQVEVVTMIHLDPHQGIEVELVATVITETDVAVHQVDRLVTADRDREASTADTEAVE